MFFKQFYLESLGHASYFVGSEQTGEALVLDARRDVQGYFEEARRQGMRIAYACDTHQHNDYVSGICELPARDSVHLLAGARAELGYTVRPMEDGARLDMGEVTFEVLHTPGHTPEHIALLVTDRSRSEEPMMLLSGGALLVGDVARPDLLGDRAQIEHNARDLCRSLRDRILPLPDHVEVYPTHVAGSLCGGNIASRLSTTIGYERRANRLLQAVETDPRFQERCLDLGELPAVPPYWRRMRRLNSDGPPLLGVLADPPPLSVTAVERAMADGATVLDCRSPEAYSAHIPGALNAGTTGAFPTWAGTILPPDRPYLLVLESAADLWPVCWELIRIGYELPVGWLAGGMRAWRMAGRPLEVLPQWDVGHLREAIERDRDLVVLDVRQPAEWSGGAIRAALRITGAELPARTDELPRDRPIAVICGSGYRSSVSASLLRHRGFPRVYNVLGGMGAWTARGYPLETPAAEARRRGD